MKNTLILILCGLIIFVACGKKENVETETKSPDKTVVEPVQTEQEGKEEKVISSSTNAPNNNVESHQEKEPSNNSSAESPSDESSDTSITPEEISSFLKGNNPGLVDKVNGNNN